MLACALAESKRQYSRSRGGGGSAAQGTAFAFRSSVRVETIGTESMSNHAQQIFKPEFRFGLGGVSLGNEFNKHTDKEAERTLEAAWDVGVRYFDVAPWYGFGLAERRFGHFLHNKKRDDYLLSSKVGKLFKASKNNRHAEIYSHLTPLHATRGPPRPALLRYVGLRDAGLGSIRGVILGREKGSHLDAI